MPFKSSSNRKASRRRFYLAHRAEEIAQSQSYYRANKDIIMARRDDRYRARENQRSMIKRLTGKTREDFFNDVKEGIKRGISTNTLEPKLQDAWWEMLNSKVKKRSAEYWTGGGGHTVGLFDSEPSPIAPECPESDDEDEGVSSDLDSIECATEAIGAV
jgi:hypothetical protein